MVGMRRTKYAVVLSDEQRVQLRTLVGRGVTPAQRLAHARILLKAGEGEGGAAWAGAAIVSCSATSLAAACSPAR